MKWRRKKEQEELKDPVYGNNSMPFLGNENLTFHRFSDGTVSVSGHQFSTDGKRPSVSSHQSDFAAPIWTTDTFPSAVATNIEFQYVTPGEHTKNLHANNTSTAKLMESATEEDDQPTEQSKCSIFRSIVLCLCLNLTYANVIRFPRELQRHGSAFLVPYFTLLFIIGLPIVLLEVSLGQFLGQGSAHTWRASPVFKGASFVGRIASWLSTIWTSLHATVAFLYIGMLIFKSVPFNYCANLKRLDDGYTAVGKSGQECLKLTFLVPVWENTLYFGLLTMALIVLWIISMVCTHSSKVVRRTIFSFGLIALVILLLQTGWEISRSITDQDLPTMWPFNEVLLGESSIWFDALVQMILSTNIGFGAIPVITGKYLHKRDAVKTTFAYVCFNIIITMIAVTYFVFQFHNPFTGTTVLFPELAALTAIYDRAQSETDPTLARVIPGISYLGVMIVAGISIVIHIYTASRILRRHPNYTLAFAAVITAIVALIAPEFAAARLLDSRFVGAFIVCALIVDILAIMWIYGAKNIYTDLEFSIGRPIVKVWIVLWVIAPLLLAGILAWWAVIYIPDELLIEYIPRWLPIVISFGVIVIVACVEVSKQVDYNFISMIRGAAKPSKDWGPADPLVRHAWKQWTSKCEDTGERDFTLRRRGTKDYTNSIKRGQYPHSKYNCQNRTSTPGSSSPNYSGSVFGDSAIEEDISVDKFQNFRQNTLATFQHDSSSPRTSEVSNGGPRSELNPRDLPGRSGLYESNFASRIEILPQDRQNYKISLVRNPMARVQDVPNPNFTQRTPYHDNYDHFVGGYDKNDHICWRKYSGNSEEYSTEL
ncbi:sodium- and chloride-dependent GABA transporter 1 [Phlebotomus argentipes]|uniref:sodium- and chloride-dependent GABA transporter 1 n=1 Tax=Phlebotomus argentipes TaxID=94469 RepID=UPI002892DA7D|nr:sodium- and chloride-dependent GABA transporter 1 [Phlebotomus argentipes]XP_059613955.1 sodium- and chloride-dependent GABA transporter 1 [Phlebotomus argentipes]